MALSLCAIGLAQLGGLELPGWFRTGAAIALLLLAVVVIAWRDSRPALRIVQQEPSEDGAEATIRTSRTLHPAAIRLTWSGMPFPPWGSKAVLTLAGRKISWQGAFGDRVPVLSFSWSNPPFRRRDKLRVKVKVGRPVRFAKAEAIDPSEIKSA